MYHRSAPLLSLSLSPPYTHRESLSSCCACFVKMPKSKRNRPVSLSKTKKKGREHKEAIVNSIREAVEKYSSIYVFAFENTRNLKFKEFREQLKSSSRFFLGSNKVVQVALGRSAADEIGPRLHKISEAVRRVRNL